MARRPDTNSADTDAAIRTGAVELFAQKGFAAVGIREIASRAGLTTAALYHYMGTKEDLLVAIMTDVIRPLIDATGRALEVNARPEQQLVALVELHVAAHGERSAETLIADTEIRALTGERRAAIIQMRDEYEAVWRSVVRHGVEAGVFEVSDDALVTTALVELCTGVAHWYRTGGRLSLTELCYMHSDLALAMVRARRNRRPVRRGDVHVNPMSPHLAMIGDGLARGDGRSRQ